MEIKDVFSAQPKSTWEYLCENGQGLYIPAYQRHYSWDKSQIKKLIEDACHGFLMLIERKDAITFIGTIIAIHDTELTTVAPIVKGDVPAKVMTIIDGQQRLTTLLIINTVLHEEIKRRSNKLQTSDENHSWLIEESMKVLSRLGKTFEEDKDYGDGPFRYYPRMIRAYDDSWSRKKGEGLARYISPIGHYLHSYGIHCRTDTKLLFKYDAPVNEQDKDKYESLKNGRSIVQKLLRSLAKDVTSQKIDDALEVPDFESIIQSEIFQHTLIKTDFSESVKEYLKHTECTEYKELLRLVLFANFILDRIAITIVTAKNEDYAFDMFESLNTTGEPLTAFETFKPRVIYTEGLDNYKDSDSYKYIEAAQGHLERLKNQKEKQDATTRLIISFALAEKGQKLPKRLSDQRRFLRESYDEISNNDGKREFVKHLANTASFMFNVWPTNKKEKAVINFSSDKDLLLCIDFLRKLNHTITIGLLVRFYSNVLSANDSDRSAKIDDFIASVKAVVAFSVLWRASRKGTDAIDSVYRNLMLVGCPDTGMNPLARSKSNTLDIASLKKSLSHLLFTKGKIGSKDDWVKKTANIPAYTNQTVVARFLLLAAAHDSAVDKNEPGLTIGGKVGLLPLLNMDNWAGETSQTIEHIAPQTRENGWLDSVYENAETVDRLGNLTLLPSSANSSIGNKSWDHKRLMYKILSAETIGDLDILLQDGKDQRIEISQNTSDLVNNSKYLPMLKSISTVTGDWTFDIIERRSIRIAELAWSRLAPWLDL